VQTQNDSSTTPNNEKEPAQEAWAPALPISPPVRGNRFFLKADQWLSRVDGWFTRLVPDELNLFAQTGRGANLMLLVAVTTGILLLFWYKPSVELAYSSVEAMHGHTLGGWIRALHRYSSDLAMMLVLLHALRMLAARKFTGSRWLPWVSGIFLFGIIWGIGWTGYWLVWDQPAQQIATISMRFLDALPIFGEPLSRLFLADRLVPSLFFFVIFFLHMLLPLLIAVGLVLHLMRLNRVRLLPGRALSVILVSVLAMIALAFPAPLDGPAQMSLKAESFIVDAWYLTPLALALRFQDIGLWIVLGSTFLIASSIPWVLGRRVQSGQSEAGIKLSSPFQTVVETARCDACHQCYHDCPYHAIQMLPRTDGRNVALQAWVDPELCVGCAVCVGSCDSSAMHLPWFDFLTEEKRILSGIQPALRQGAPVHMALVCMDIEGIHIPSEFPFDIWQKRLPGFKIYPVPTAGWIRSQFMEKLLREGAQSVLVVRDARTVSNARDGNHWLSRRLTRTRKPYFRPRRAGPGRWHVEPYNPAHPRRLLDVAAALRGNRQPSAPEPRRGKAFILAASAVLCLAATSASVAPSHLKVKNPAPPDPEFILSLKVLGDRQEMKPPELNDQSERPVHMRGGPVEKPQRSVVTVTLTVNNQTMRRQFHAKGISRDGPAIDIWRTFLKPGNHDIKVEIDPGPRTDPYLWSGAIEARPRLRQVLTFEPDSGFLLE